MIKVRASLTNTHAKTYVVKNITSNIRAAPLESLVEISATRCVMYEAARAEACFRLNPVSCVCVRVSV